MTNHASKFSFDAFAKMTGGSLERAYEIFGGVAATALDAVQRFNLIRTCPQCNKTMLFYALQKNPQGFTGRWLCTDEAGEPSDWCGYEELTTDSLLALTERYGVKISENAPLYDISKVGEDSEAAEKAIAGIYEHAPRTSRFPRPVDDWARRRCPQCGTPMVFYATKDGAVTTGVFACPKGWDVSEDPEAWCGYEEVTNEPLASLFAEYYERSPNKQHAAAQLLLRECPWCGSYLVPRPIETNERGWRTRWICQKGFTKDDPDLLCGYEELTTETVGSYITAINKIIAES